MLLSRSLSYGAIGAGVGTTTGIIYAAATGFQDGWQKTMLISAGAGFLVGMGIGAAATSFKAMPALTGAAAMPAGFAVRQGAAIGLSGIASSMGRGLINGAIWAGGYTAVAAVRSISPSVNFYGDAFQWKNFSVFFAAGFLSGVTGGLGNISRSGAYTLAKVEGKLVAKTVAQAQLAKYSVRTAIAMKQIANASMLTYAGLTQQMAMMQNRPMNEVFSAQAMARLGAVVFTGGSMLASGMPLLVQMAGTGISWAGIKGGVYVATALYSGHAVDATRLSMKWRRDL